MNAQIVLENVGVRFPDRVLFEKINWTLYEGMRVALAGRNGTGKSTLLRILAGKAEPLEGSCSFVGGKRLRIGYLDQTLLDTAVVETIGDKDKGLAAPAYIKERLLKNVDPESEIEVDWQIKKILGGLGFEDELMDRPIGALSGGWLLRMFIASALVENPDVLLLDEPTNHLDISTIRWLEDFLKKEYQGTIVLITHDVALQKRVTDSLAILHGGHFYYRKHQQDYLSFQESLTEEKRILEKTIEGLDKKIADNIAFAERFRAKAQTAARAQSKLKLADNLQQERDELKDRLERVVGFSHKMHFRFRTLRQGPKFPVSLENVSFRYGPDTPWILKHISLDVKRGQKIAIIGDNGAGKTTLLNVLAERLKATEGSLTKGANLDEGYFGQHQLDELSLEDTVFDNLKQRAEGVSMEQLRGWLGAFGFVGDRETTKKAKVLSGGERARLALVRILLTPINFCLLDEPTNHLDIETKEILKNAIKNFEGAVVFVSHDREFISGIAERIIYLSHDHTLTDHIGDLNSFFEKHPQFKSQDEPPPAPKKIPKENRLSYEERKKIRNAIGSLQKKVAAAEAEISSLDEKKTELKTLCAAPSFYHQPVDVQQSKYAELAEIDARIHALMIDWEKWSKELELLLAKQNG